MFKISKFDFYTFTMSYLYRAFASPGSIYVNFMKTVIHTGLKIPLHHAFIPPIFTSRLVKTFSFYYM